MRFLILLLFCLGGMAFAKEPSKANGDPYKLYTDVLSGERSSKSLTPEEERQFMMIHSLLANSCAQLRGVCKAACEASSDLEKAATELTRCAKRRDLSDDCGRPAREVRDAAENYESAVNDSQGECD